MKPNTSFPIEMLHLLLRRRSPSRDAVQRDAGISSDYLGYLLYAPGNRLVVVGFMQRRNHGSPDVACLGVRQNAFQPVPHLDAVLVILNREEKEQPSIRTLAAHLPFLFQRYRVIVDRFAVERLDGHHRNLRMRLVIDLRAQCVQRFLSLRRKHSGKIINVIGGLGQVRDALCRRDADTHRDQAGESKRAHPICKHVKPLYSPDAQRALPVRERPSFSFQVLVSTRGEFTSCSPCRCCCRLRVAEPSADAG